MKFALKDVGIHRQLKHYYMKNQGIILIASLIAASSPTFANVIGVGTSASYSTDMSSDYAISSDMPEAYSGVSTIGQTFYAREYVEATGRANNLGHLSASTWGSTGYDGHYGNFSGQAYASLFSRFENSGSSSVALDCNCLIMEGYARNGLYGVEGSDFEYSMLGNSQLRASFRAEISVNGSSRWFSTATLGASAAGTVFDYSGVAIWNEQDGGWLSWDTQSFSLDLGTVAAGESVTVEYRLWAEISAELDETALSALNLEGCYTVDGVCFDPSLTVVFEDPAGFSLTTPASMVSFSASPATTVPAPATVALLGLGLLALSRRKMAR